MHKKYNKWIAQGAAPTSHPIGRPVVYALSCKEWLNYKKKILGGQAVVPAYCEELHPQATSRTGLWFTLYLTKVYNESKNREGQAVVPL